MPHTPGPWTIDEDAPQDIIGEVSGDGLIGTAFTVRGSEDGDDQSADNARLMAAAPELLEALKAVLVMWDRGPCPSKLDAALSWRENDEKARKMATDAIAKAEGR